jgi:hypothetical protein
MGYKFNPTTGKLDIVSDPGGSNTSILFNDDGTFGGDVDLTYNKTTNLLTTKGDILLDDGGSFSSTLQMVTPTANRIISLPDATGTVALVGGSSGQVTYNLNGANAGLNTLTADSSGNLTLSGRLTNVFNSIVGVSAKLFSGTWASGGSATTTKPHFLIEPAGTTSNNFNIAGTGFGVNAPTGFAGDLAWLGVGGSSSLVVQPSHSGAKLNFGPSASLRGTTLGGQPLIEMYAQSGVGLRMRSDQGFVIEGLPLGFAVAASAATTFLRGEGDNTLSQRNGAAAQTSRIYNTFTDGSNYERLAFKWTSNTFQIQPEAAGTGVVRPLQFPANGLLNTPPVSLTGTWFTGGQASTTKPQFLIEPAGTTSNNWSTLGTGFGVNAPSGFAGNLLDLQVNGTSRFKMSAPQPTGFRITTDIINFIACDNSVGIQLSAGSSLVVDSIGVKIGNTYITGNAANALEQRNGANAQTSRIYNTYTSDTNFERAKIDWASNILRIGTEKGSAGGTARDMELQTDGTTRLSITSAGEIVASGRLLVSTMAFTGTTITYAAQVTLDLAAITGSYCTISLTGALQFLTSNRAGGRQVTIRLICDSTARALTFPAGWVFVGTKPSTIAASKTAVLSLTYFGTADSDCVAAYGVQT